MKKETLLIFIIFLFISLVSAKISCSDGSSVQWDQKEIDKYERKDINGLRLAVSAAVDYNVLQTINVNLILEATLVTLTNETPSQELELSTGKYTVTFSNVSNSAAKITINGESKNLIKNEPETIKGLPILLLNTQTDPKNIEMIVGIRQISLSTKEEPSKIINITNSTFIIELISASSANAIIKVSKCKSGNIFEETSLNKTQEDNKTTNINTNHTVNLNNTNNQNNTNQTTTTNQQNQQKPGFFKRILNWFKGLFSWL